MNKVECLKFLDKKLRPLEGNKNASNLNFSVFRNRYNYHHIYYELALFNIDFREKMARKINEQF